MQQSQISSQKESKQTESECLRTVSCRQYAYTITPHDLQAEQEAFEAGEGVRNSVQKLTSNKVFVSLLFHCVTYLISGKGAGKGFWCVCKVRGLGTV